MMRPAAASRNVRRFFRINMPIRYFVTPSSPIRDREILASGANYFPPSVRKQLDDQKFELVDSLKRIQDSREVLTEIFSEIVDHIEFFGQCCEDMAKGINPRFNTTYWYTISSHLEGLPKIKLLEQKSPKTYSYLKIIEEKYLYFMNRLAEVITKSSPDTFYAEQPIPYGFQLDELCGKFSGEKFSKIPLVRTIVAAAKYIDTYTEVFRQMHDDHSQRQHPENWPLEVANVSASGLALMLRKGLKLHEHLDVLIYFPHDRRILQFEGVVVNIQSDEAKSVERVAMNFEFPDGKDQLYLLTEIQKHEIEECFGL